VIVRDFMTSNVFTVRIDHRVFAAQEIMSWAHVRHVPVVDPQGELVGMISHRDVLRASLSSRSERPELEKRMYLQKIPIRDIMQSVVATVDPETRIKAAARRMRESKIGCLPVVERNRLVGIITEHDLLQLIERIDATCDSYPSI